MHSKRKNCRIRGREGKMHGASGDLQISPLNWRVGFIWEFWINDICRNQIHKGQTRNLKLHKKVMGNHLCILGSGVT